MINELGFKNTGKYKENTNTVTISGRQYKICPECGATVRLNKYDKHIHLQHNISPNNSEFQNNDELIIYDDKILKTLIKDSEKSQKQPQDKKNYYIQKIGHLAFKASNGDINAQSKLEVEITRHSFAKEILKNILESDTLHKYNPNPNKSSNSKGYAKAKEFSYGSVFRPYLGGAYGLGKSK